MEIGTPFIFKRIKGNNRKIKGIIKLNNGEIMLHIDIICKKCGE